jgi:hypothetical protein
LRKHFAISVGRETPLLAGLLFWLVVAIPCSLEAAGVTVITHGFDSDADGWVAAMADEITNYHSFPGTNWTTYKITLTTDGTDYYYQSERDSGGSPLSADSGEIIVKLDWSQMAGTTDILDDPYDRSTYIVAGVASEALLKTNAIPELNGHALAEYPIHLIGHSRGGSLMNELSRILGTNGIWVDHLTTLDPHPFNNDGNDDSIFPPVDASASNTWANVLFRDNYWQDLSTDLLDPTGEPAAGAYNRQLTKLSGGYADTDSISPNHSNVHLWYYGTINWDTPATYNYDDDTAAIDASARTNWWVSYEHEGTNAGFEYSLLGGGDRMGTNQPLGKGFPAIVDGYNQWWDLGAGKSSNRTALAANNGAWPNLIKLNVTGPQEVTQGGSVATTFYYQYGGNSPKVTAQFYFGRDFNPYNTNGILISEMSLTNTGTKVVSSIAAALTTASVPVGLYSLYGRISDGALTRYLYAPELVRIVSNPTPPVLSIIATNGSQFLIAVASLSNQPVALQTSSDLQHWVSLATNTFMPGVWNYTPTNLPPSVGGQFFRALVLP